VLLVESRSFLPLPPLLARRVVAEPWKGPERERIGAEHPPDEVILDIPAHPFDDRYVGDEEHHSDRHTGELEAALELLHADLGEGEPNGFEEGHEAPMSSRA